MEVSKIDKATIKTTLPTLPYPAVETRPKARTERLLIRPPTAADAEELHVLRTQPEVMTWTARGTVDKDLEATREFLSKRLAPHDGVNYDFAICLASTGELIGMGGSHLREGALGWPDLGYLFRKEAWGKGYATEFLKAFLAIWWALPREEVELTVDRHTVAGDEGEIKQERIMAITVTENMASHGVLRKNGLELVKVWEEADLRDKTKMVQLPSFAAKRPTT